MIIRQPTIASLTDAFILTAEQQDANADECCIAIGGLITAIAGMTKLSPAALSEKISATVAKATLKRSGN